MKVSKVWGRMSKVGFRGRGRARGRGVWEVFGAFQKGTDSAYNKLSFY